MLIIRSGLCALLLALLSSAGNTQQKTSPSGIRSSPQIMGKFIESDGVRRLTLAYPGNLKSETFTGRIQSPCMVPDPSKPGESQPLDFSTIRIGTPMTVFYVRHAQRRNSDKQPENVILAVRFDRVRGPALPVGVAIPCFRGAAPGAK